MARTSALGKRKATADLPPSSIVTRKRRALRTVKHDENVDLEILQDADESQNPSYSEDELAKPCNPSSTSSRNNSSLAKHGAKRVALSPTKGNGQKKNPQTSKSIEKENLATPSNPRNRDIFAEFAKPTTPASTPKSCVQVAAKLPSTPRTPATPRSSTSIYNCARQLFARSTTTGQLIGRDNERDKLHEFLKEGIKSRSGRCLYVSGPPGTGKSACVGEICNQFSNSEVTQVTYINCMSIKSAREIYDRLAAEVCGDISGGSGGAATALRSTFFSNQNSRVHIVTLDEIDHLLTLDLSCLYTIFEWALSPESRLLLIGIANALDFTDRFLPRLKARSLKAQLLPFAPYTVTEIDSVITTKLRSLLPADSPPTAELPFLRPEAIKLLARKVTAQTGDLRKAFDIVRGTIDLIEGNARAAFSTPAKGPPTPPLSSPLSENKNLASLQKHKGALPTNDTPPATPQKQDDALSTLTISSAPRATIAHVARVTASVFSNGTASRLKSLTLQQKAALCSLLSLEKKTTARLKELALGTPSKSTFSKATGVEARRVWEMYADLVKREGSLLAVLTRTEFGEVMDGLLEAGLVREAGKTKSTIGASARGRVNAIGVVEKRIESAVTETEVRGSLEGVAGELLVGLLGEE